MKRKNQENMTPFNKTNLPICLCVTENMNKKCERHIRAKIWDMIFHIRIVSSGVVSMLYLYY